MADTVTQIPAAWTNLLSGIVPTQLPGILSAVVNPGASGPAQAMATPLVAGGYSVTPAPPDMTGILSQLANPAPAPSAYMPGWQTPSLMPWQGGTDASGAGSSLVGSQSLSTSSVPSASQSAYDQDPRKPAPITDPAGNPIPVPPNVSLQQNMDAVSHFLNMHWFYNQENDGQPWDYKRQNGMQYDDFGNFNYGATGTAMGFPQQLLDRAAGYVHGKDNPTRPQPGSWYGAWPYGNDPHDLAIINQGIAYEREYPP